MHTSMNAKAMNLNIWLVVTKVKKPKNAQME